MRLSPLLVLFIVCSFLASCLWPSPARRISTLPPALAAEATSNEEEIKDWFAQYDQIRRQAKMNLKEKFQTRRLLVMALSPILLPLEGSEQLLKNLIARYSEAIASIENLPPVPATERLRLGYLRYFTEAKQLFIDTTKVPTDDSRRQYMAALLERKKSLEELDHENKELDASLRKQYSIPPFRG